MTSAPNIRFAVAVLTHLFFLQPVYAGVTTVHNPDRGSWDSDPTRSLEFAVDLTIGASDGDTTSIFGRIADVAVDANGNIYVLDSGFCRVQVYDQGGIFMRTLGRRGEGPGEFVFPTAIGVGVNGQVLVADNNFVEVLNNDGTHQGQFRLPYAGMVFSLKSALETGFIYISCFDVVEQNIVHVFDAQYDHVASFSKSWAADLDLDVRLEMAGAGGRIDVDRKGTVYFTQFAPYEIRVFSATGGLLRRVYRDNTFLPAPPTQLDVSTVYAPHAMSSSIVLIDDNHFLNVVSIASDDRQSTTTVIDLFSATGELLLSQEYERSLYLRTGDSLGRVYAVDTTDFPAVKRYVVSTTSPASSSQPAQ